MDEAHEVIVMIEGFTEEFGAGRHTLGLQNYIGRDVIRHISRDGKTIFPCTLHFINKVHVMDILWVTPDKFQLFD